MEKKVLAMLLAVVMAVSRLYVTHKKPPLFRRKGRRFFLYDSASFDASTRLILV